MGSLTKVAPELPVHELAAALEYYTGRLGFEVAAILPGRDYAIVERDDVSLHLSWPRRARSPRCRSTCSPATSTSCSASWRAGARS